MTGWQPQQYDPRHRQQYDPRRHQQRVRGRHGEHAQMQQPYPQQPYPYPQQPYPQQPAPPYGGQGQVQPYAYPPLFQGYPQYDQPQYGQPQYSQPQYSQPHQYGQPPQYAPAVAPKSTGVGLVLGLLLPGVGCMYAGRAGIGVLLLALWLISIPLVFVLGIGFVTGIIVWIASAVLGYTMTREWNAAHGIVS